MPFDSVPPPRRCHACGSRGARRLLFRQSFVPIEGGTLLRGYDVVACSACGFCFADLIPPQAELDAYYRAMSKYERNDRDGRPTPFEVERASAAAELIARHAAPEARVLDVGCANGVLLGQLKRRGFCDLLGLDPSPACSRNAARVHDVEVAVGALNDLDERRGPWDVIVLASVLEHLEDIGAALGRLNGLLAAGGMLYLEVPDATAFPELDDAPFQEFSIEHINYFSPSSLDILMARFGLHRVLCQRSALDVNGGTTIRELRAIYTSGPPPPPHDAESAPAIARYVERCAAEEERIARVIDALCRDRTPLLVWGAGTHTQRLLATSSLSRCEIAAFVDSNRRYQGKALAGRAIVAPDRIVGRGESILISSRQFQEEIAALIRDRMGCSNPVIRLYPRLEER